MADKFCVMCGNQFGEAHKVCGKCGNVIEVKKKKARSSRYYKDNILHDNGFPIPSELIKKVEELLNKESSLRLQIVCKKQRLKGLLDIKPNQTGVINVEANNKKIKVKETTFRLLIQKDIDGLVEELIHDAEALEEFNKKFK